MKFPKSIFALFCGLSLFATVAIGGVLVITDHSHHTQSKKVTGHSGGLDKCGGHYNRKTGSYHYHRTPKC